MRVYADDNGQVLFTYLGPDELAPEGAYITEPDQDIGDLTGWRVEGGVRIRPPGWAAAQLAAARAHASLAKSDLLIRLATFEILSDTDAETAATGAIPAALAALLDALPPEARTAARIKWAADTEISRNHPVIVSAAYALGLPDELVDEIFEVEVPSEN